jgi:hypothetical protein
LIQRCHEILYGITYSLYTPNYNSSCYFAQVKKLFVYLVNWPKWKVVSTWVSFKPLQLIHTYQYMDFTNSILWYLSMISRDLLDCIHFNYNKSEFFEHFMKFKLLVENPFFATIKQFQSDWGGEYTSLEYFQYFLTKHAWDNSSHVN